MQQIVDDHDGAIDITIMNEDAQNPEIKYFGSKVVENQSMQIEEMNSMLARLK